MSKENEAYKIVLSQVAEEVNEMYEKYRRGCNLEEESDTAKQLKILANKKYISNTYISDISLIASYYAEDMITKYTFALLDYKYRVRNQIESIPY